MQLGAILQISAIKKRVDIEGMNSGSTMSERAPGVGDGFFEWSKLSHLASADDDDARCNCLLLY